MGVCSNMSEILGNHMHVTQMSRLLICISSSRCTSGHRKQLSAPPGTQNTNADDLPIYQQGQPCAQPFPLTPGCAALSDLRPSSHPTTVTHMHRPSQAPVPQAQVKRSQGPRPFLLLYGLLPDCATMIKPCYCLVVFCLLPFLVLLMKSGMSSTQTSPAVLLHISTARTISGWHHLCVHRTLFTLMYFLCYWCAINDSIIYVSINLWPKELNGPFEGRFYATNWF